MGIKFGWWIGGLGIGAWGLGLGAWGLRLSDGEWEWEKEGRKEGKEGLGWDGIDELY